MKVTYPDLSSRPFDMSVEQRMQAKPAALYDAWTVGFERWFAGQPAVLLRDALRR